MDRYSPVPSEAIEPRRRILGYGLLALAAAMAANSVLGPLVFDVIDYPVSATMRNQTIGLDAANLAVVGPACAVIGWLVLRRNRWASLFALGPTTYAAYMFVQYVAGPDHLEYPRVLLLQLVSFVLGWMLAIVAWMERPKVGRLAGDRPTHAVVVALLAAFVLLRYASGLLGSFAEEPLPSEIQADPAMYWLIFLMDLGVFVPAAFVVIAGLWQGSTWAAPALAGLIGWYLLVTIAVGAMSIVMEVNDDRLAGDGQVALFAGMTIALAVYGLLVFQGIRSGFRPRNEPYRTRGE